MFTKFQKVLAARRRRRAFIKIRREFARCGYPLDDVADAEIEAALPPGTCETPPDRLGAKTISRALRRLPVRGGRRHGPSSVEVRGDVIHGGRVASPLRKVRQRE